MSRFRKSLIAVVTSIGVVAALAGCSGGSTSSGGKTEVSVAVLGPGSLQWLHAIAKAKGFYADNDVRIKDIQVQNSGSLVQSVASGSADAGIALGDNVIKSVDQGANVKITGALIQKPALRLYGAKGVTKATQLSGKKVTAGATEGGTYDLLLYMLQKEGVPTKSLTPVAIANSSDRVTALKNGQVSGALLIPPFDTLAARAGAKNLGWYGKNWLETPSIVNGDWAKKNPDGARGFTQGLKKAAEYFADPENEASCEKILQGYSGVDAAAAKQAYTFISNDHIFSSDLSVPKDSLENIAKISAAVAGKKAGPLDESKYVDDSYLK